MRKVFANKWFILASLLTISLSAFSFANYRKARANDAGSCYQKPCQSGDRGELFWDFVSRQLPSVSFQ